MYIMIALYFFKFLLRKLVIKVITFILKHFSRVTVDLYSVIRLGMELSSYYLYFRVTFH